MEELNVPIINSSDDMTSRFATCCSFCGHYGFVTKVDLSHWFDVEPFHVPLSCLPLKYPLILKLKQTRIIK